MTFERHVLVHGGAQRCAERYLPLRVQTVKAVAVQVMTNLPVDAMPMEIIEELSCEREGEGAGEGEGEREREEGERRWREEREKIARGGTTEFQVGHKPWGGSLW